MSELIVKDNALINASYNLDLVEQRLILLAIIEARETGKGINASDAVTVHASSYIHHFNVEKHTAYTALKKAVDDLFERRFSYNFINKNGNIEHVKSRWVSEIRYVENEGAVKLIFAPSVVPLITRLEQHFTSYELKQVSQLSSRYAVRLYELLIAWRSVGHTPVFELEQFRNQLGVAEDEYQRMELFKRRVLDIAIEQINKFTDITTEYIQHKKGRSITGFSFKFKQKKESILVETKDQNTPDLFFKMTEAQLNMLSSKLADLPQVGSKIANVGEDPKAFITRLREMLIDKKRQKQLHPYLKQLGFEIKVNSSF